MALPLRLAAVALSAITSVASCARCGSAPEGASTGAASASAAAIPPPPTAPPAAAAAANLPDLPEIKDTGPGRATAALRAALTAYGIAFDAATLERECQVDDDGASIDDLEDVAVDKYGLDAVQLILPAEHVLLAEPLTLPGLTIIEGPPGSDTVDFVLLWKLDGDRVQIMDPVEGKQWIPRADLQKRLYVHEMPIAADEWHAVETASSYQEALRTRLQAIGFDREAAGALLARAAGDPGSRAIGALDAAVRQIEADPAKAGSAREAAGKAVDCALDAACKVDIPASLWTARPGPSGPDGQPQVMVRGAILLAVSGKKAPAP